MEKSVFNNFFLKRMVVGFHLYENMQICNKMKGQDVAFKS